MAVKSLVIEAHELNSVYIILIPLCIAQSTTTSYALALFFNLFDCVSKYCKILTKITVQVVALIFFSHCKTVNGSTVDFKF